MLKLEANAQNQHKRLLANIASFGIRLKSSNGIDYSYRLSDKLSAIKPPSLTPNQIEKLNALRHRRISVKDRDGVQLFQISIQQIINHIEGLIKRIPGAELQDVQLVGSGAASILDEDREFNISVQLLLSPDSEPVDLSHESVIPNDIDVRFILKGCTVKDRKWLSEKLLEYYTELAKEQATDHLAFKVASAMQERGRSVQIANMARHVPSFLDNQTLPGLDPDVLRKIQRLILTVPWDPLNLWTKDQRARRIAERYIHDLEPHIVSGCARQIGRHFKVPCELSRTDGNLVVKVSKRVMRREIFDKLCHVDDQQASNSFSIQSFSGLEAILAQNINSHLLSVDASKISLRTLKVKGGMQALFDRMMRVVRIDHLVLTAMHFLKYHSYKIQGIDPESESTENVLVKAFEWFLKDPVRFEKAITSFFDNHVGKDPLKKACFLFSCCLSIAKYSSEETKGKFLRYCQGWHDLANSTGWPQVLYTLLTAEDVPLRDSECIIQALSALYLRKKLPDRPTFNIAVREDLEQKAIRFELAASTQAHYYLHFVRKAKNILEECCSLIESSLPHQRIFCLLYSHILGDQEIPKLQLLELLREVANWHTTRTLWSKVVRNIKEDSTRKKVCQAATAAGVFENASVVEEAIWDFAPIDEVTRKVVNMFSSGKEGPAWILAHNVMRKRGEQARPVVEALSELALKSNFGVSWNLSQIHEFMKFYSADDKWQMKWLLKCVQKAVTAAVINPEVKPAAYIWLERMLNKKVLETADYSEAYKILMSFLKRVEDDNAHSCPAPLMQAFHDNISCLLARSATDEDRYNLLEKLRTRNIPHAVNEVRVRCAIAGYGSALSDVLDAPVKQSLQTEISHLPSYLTPEKELDPQWAILLNTFFDRVLKSRQFSLLDSFMEFASSFPSLSRSCNDKSMQEMHRLLDGENPSAKLNEIMKLQRYCTNVTLEIWAKLFKAAVPSRETSLKNELWELWEKHAYDPTQFPGQENQWIPVWILALPFLREGRQKPKLIKLLGHIEALDKIFTSSEGLTHIEPILAEIRNLSPDKAVQAAHGIRKLRSMMPAERNLEEMFNFDLWWVGICLDRVTMMTEGIGILEILCRALLRQNSLEKKPPWLAAVITKSAEICCKAWINTAHVEIPKETLEVLDRIHYLLPKECPTIINDLWGSPHVQHARIVQEQLQLIWKKPRLSVNVGVRIMNLAILKALDSPGDLDFDNVAEIYKRPPFKENEEMAESAKKLMITLILKDLCNIQYIYATLLASLPPSVRIDPFYYNQWLVTAEVLLTPGNAADFYKYVKYYYHLIMETFREGIVTIINPDLYQDLPMETQEEKGEVFRLDIHAGKSGQKPKGMQYLGAMAFDIFNMIQQHIHQIPSRRERAILLDMAYSCMQTAIASNNLSRPDQVKVVEEYITMCPSDGVLKNHHLQKKSIPYIEYIQGHSQIFNDNIEKMHELLFYCCREKSTEKVTSKDSATVDFNTRLKILRGLVLRLQEGSENEEAHACNVVQATLGGFLKNSPEAFLELYTRALPTFLKFPYNHFRPSVVHFMLENIYLHVKSMKWKNPEECRQFLKRIFFVHMPIYQQLCEHDRLPQYLLMIETSLSTISQHNQDVFEHFSNEYADFLTRWLPVICEKIKKGYLCTDTGYKNIKGAFLKQEMIKDKDDEARQKSMCRTLIQKLIEVNNDNSRQIMKQLIQDMPKDSKNTG